MFLEKCEKIAIDGTTFDITNTSQVELWNCKDQIVQIYNFFDDGMIESTQTAETYLTWRKDLIKLLKEWDRLYMKHMKSGYVEMSAIHSKAMKPLTDLLESNLNFTYLEKQMKKKEVPKFRFEALETKFCEHLTHICQIFRDYGELKDYFNIRQMLTVLKTEDWRKIPPIAYYLEPLQDALTDVRECLLEMNKKGALRCKYIIEHNDELQTKVKHMVKMDITAQWLAGDQLKQDQFKFLYKVVKIIYDSALREQLLAEEARILDPVIPNLTIFHSLLVIKSILETKLFERKKEQEKSDRVGKQVTFNE